MSNTFLAVVNMSIAASWIVLAVLILRRLLKKAPKWATVALWGIVAVRLICPLTIESAISLIPSAQTVSPDIMMDRTPAINSGVPYINNIVNPIISSVFAPDPVASANPLQILIPIASVLWLIGIAAMLVYAVVSYFLVRRKIKTAVLLRDNIYQCETVASPFVLGVIKPRIYLPFNMSKQDAEHVIAHEMAHISRKDHIWKPIGFLILALHWFNLLMWLAYVLLCRDIELACDEKVVKELENEKRADYSQALLTCSVSRRSISACPLAFGEVGVKERVKHVLSYKKPTFWIIIIVIIALAVVGVCTLTSPETVDNSEVEALRQQFPIYFDLPTENGLEIYIYQMATNSYSCILVPGGKTDTVLPEILEYPSVNMDKMRKIVASYFPDVQQKDVKITPIKAIHSSYLYNIDEEYQESLEKLFWSDFPQIRAQ